MKKNDDVKFESIEKNIDSFLDDNSLSFSGITSIIIDSDNPENVEDILKIVHKCIDAFEDDFIIKLKSKPYSDVFEVMSELQAIDKNLLKDSFVETTKAYDYDGALFLMRHFGHGKIPPKAFVDKLRAGRFFERRFFPFWKVFQSIEPSVDFLTAYFNSLGQIDENGVQDLFHEQLWSNFFLLVLLLCSSFYKNDEEKSSILGQFSKEFLVLITKLSYIQNFKNSNQWNDVRASLSFLINFVALDYLKITDLFFGKKFGKLMQKSLGSVNRTKGWSTLELYYKKACEIAKQRWENGDERYHHQMAEDLLEEINEPIRDQIMAELLDKYPQKNKDPVEKQKFEDEKKRRFSYETLSFVTLKKRLRDIAKKYGKYYDPGAKYREKLGQ